MQTTTASESALQLTLIHVLAGEPPCHGSVKARTTVRTGTVNSGDSVWYERADGTRYTLTVVSVDHTARWATIVFSGPSEALAGIHTGTYIRSGVPRAFDCGMPTAHAATSRGSDA
jgi:hypothetical protein